MKKIFPIVGALILLGLGLTYFGPQDEDKAIREFLKQTIHLANIPEDAGPIKLRQIASTIGQSLSPNFAGTYQVDSQHRHQMTSKLELINTLSTTFHLLKPLDIIITEMSVDLGFESTTASVVSTLRVQHRERTGPMSVEFTFKLEKVDGVWLILSADGREK